MAATGKDTGMELDESAQYQYCGHPMEMMMSHVELSSNYSDSNSEASAVESAATTKGKLSVGLVRSDDNYDDRVGVSGNTSPPFIDFLGVGAS